MSLNDALNTDVGQLWPIAQRGWRWWTGQLASMTPRPWRSRGSGGLVAERVQNGRGWRIARDGRTVSMVTTPMTRLQRTTIVLPEDQVLVRETELPAASAQDLRAMADFEIDRLMPFPPGSAVHDLVVGPAGSGPRRQVLVGAAPVADAISLLNDARAMGFMPVRLAAMTGQGVQFDFLPQLSTAGTQGSRRSLVWGLAIGGLIAFNVFLLIFRDINSVRALRGIVDAQRDSVDIALRIRKTADAERAQRAVLLERRWQGSPLRLLAMLNTALPQDAWVHRLAWNGDALRLVGFKSGGVDVVRALRASPELTNVRSLGGEQAASDDRQRQPFDVGADRRTVR